MSTRAMACCAMLAAAWMLAAPARANDSAHAVADKFANEPDRTAAAKREADRKAEDARKREAEINADKAREEAAARRAAEALKADKEKTDKAKRAKAPPAEAARIAAERRKAEEAEMLARAQREAEETVADEARILAEQAAAVERTKAELLASQAAEAERAKLDALAREAIRTKPAVADGAAAEAARAKAEAQALEAARVKQAAADAEAAKAELALIEWARRADATRRQVHKLKRVREIREARLAAKASRVAAQERQPIVEPPRTATARDTKPEVATTGSGVETAASQVDTNKMPNPPAAVDPVRPEPAGADRRRVEEPRLAAAAGMRERVVTVLLVMAPGNYGIRRRGPKVADPVLCTTEGCYISTGAGTPARFMPGRKATGFGNTMGGRAGACRQQLGCIFRGVALDQEQNFLQPVDLHILKHDRRQPHAVTSDSECRVDGGRISCNRGIYAADYAMWVIPESIADALGPHALQEALEDGLAAPRSADLNPRLR